MKKTEWEERTEKHTILQDPFQLWLLGIWIVISYLSGIVLKMNTALGGIGFIILFSLALICGLVPVLCSTEERKIYYRNRACW